MLGADEIVQDTLEEMGNVLDHINEMTGVAENQRKLKQIQDSLVVGRKEVRVCMQLSSC